MTDETATAAGPWLRDPGPRRKLPRALCNKRVPPTPVPGSPVDLRAFVAAFLATPILIAVLGAVLIIPAFAVLWGLPAYVLAGLPACWIVVARCHRFGRPLGLWPFVQASLIANLFTPLCVALNPIAFGGVYYLHPGLLWGTAFGLVFAPLMGVVFALLYRHWLRR
ncbi:MAG: hypothetical protein AAF416_19210 [Pseudomonadota bacterium]